MSRPKGSQQGATRKQILAFLRGNQMTVKEIASNFGIAHQNIQTHVQMLRASGKLVEAGKKLNNTTYAVVYTARGN